MVNQVIRGKVYPPINPYLVGREKVREFARATLSTSPLHFDLEKAQQAGYSDLVAPPTFAIVIQEATLQQLLSDESADVDFSRVVHGDQRFIYQRPIVAGDELIGQMTITDVKQLGGHSMVTSTTEIHDAAHEHVATAISTLVVRGQE